MKILAFGHRKQVGKDTAARFLASEVRLKHRGVNVQKVGFADKVKDVAYQLFSWAGLMPGDYYETSETEKLKEVVLTKMGKTPRQLWIGVGNGIRSATGYDGVWLDYVFKQTKCDVLIIKDLRFPAEADGILNAGGLLYKINCPWAPVVTDGADDPLQNYDKWTGIIQNDEYGNQRKLHDQILELVERYF